MFSNMERWEEESSPCQMLAIRTSQWKVTSPAFPTPIYHQHSIPAYGRCLGPRESPV